MIDAETLLRFGSALAFVLALIAGLAWLGRRNQIGGSRPGRRLGVVETVALDGKARAVLLRRDDVEHLVILHAGGTAVVETAIRPPSPATQGTPVS